MCFPCRNLRSDPFSRTESLRLFVYLAGRTEATIIEGLGHIERDQLVPDGHHLKPQLAAGGLAVDAVPIGERGYAAGEGHCHFKLGEDRGAGRNKLSACQMRDRPCRIPAPRIADAKLFRDKTVDNELAILGGNLKRSLSPRRKCHR